jgi:hypothetical protein
VTVDVESKAYISVAQKFLNELGIYTLFQQERGAGVPQVVEAGTLREPGALERSLESAVEGRDSLQRTVNWSKAWKGK